MLTVTAEQRDALYTSIVDNHLSGIEDVWLAVKVGNYEDAERLAQEYTDELQLILNDLGWGEGDGKLVELSTSRDVLRRCLTRIRDRAIEHKSELERERVQAEAILGQNCLVIEACRKLLAGLE